MLITIDTERSSPEEIRKALRILAALEDSTEGIRSSIKALYDVLAAKVNAERRIYREMARKRARNSEFEQKDVNKKGQPGVAKGGGMFQGVELGY